MESSSKSKLTTEQTEIIERARISLNKQIEKLRKNCQVILEKNDRIRNNGYSVSEKVNLIKRRIFNANYFQKIKSESDD